MMKNIKKVFETILTRYKATYHSGSWYINEQGLVIVINIQKSNYSDLNFLNLGISIDAIKSIVFPKEQLCHIRLRLGNILLSDDPTALQAILDRILTPILDAIKTIDDIKRMYKDGFFDKAFIHKDVKALFKE